MGENKGLIKLELRPAVKDVRVQIYRDSQNHLHLYYNGVYRCVISAGFHRDAEISFWDTRDYLEIRSMGQGVIRFPFRFDAKIDENLGESEEEEWPDVIGELGEIG